MSRGKSVELIIGTTILAWFEDFHVLNFSAWHPRHACDPIYSGISLLPADAAAEKAATMQANKQAILDFILLTIGHGHENARSNEYLV